MAAYGVVANTSLVAVALFNGIAQGSQPLITTITAEDFRKSRLDTQDGCRFISLNSHSHFSYHFFPFYLSFHSEHDARLASYAESGLRLYFLTGFIFAGINIVGSAILCR